MYAHGDHGVICTLDNPVYLTRVKGKPVYCLARSARPRTIMFDLTEYCFKLALLRNNYEEMLYIICRVRLNACCCCSPFFKASVC